MHSSRCAQSVAHIGNNWIFGLLAQLFLDLQDQLFLMRAVQLADEGRVLDAIQSVVQAEVGDLVRVESSGMS